MFPSTLTVSTLAPSTLVPSALATADRNILLDLFHSTAGCRWWEKDYWNTDAELSNWHGVKVNGEGRVVELRLLANNLRGVLGSTRSKER